MNNRNDPLWGQMGLWVESKDHWCLCNTSTVLPVKSDSDVMFCLQSYQGLRIDRSLVY